MVAFKCATIIVLLCVCDKEIVLICTWMSPLELCGEKHAEVRQSVDGFECEELRRLCREGMVTQIWRDDEGGVRNGREVVARVCHHNERKMNHKWERVSPSQPLAHTMQMWDINCQLSCVKESDENAPRPWQWRWWMKSSELRITVLCKDGSYFSGQTETWRLHWENLADHTLEWLTNRDNGKRESTTQKRAKTKNHICIQ